MNKLLLIGYAAGLAAVGALSVAVIKGVEATTELEQQLAELRTSMDRADAAMRRVKAFPQEEPALRRNEQLIDQRLPARGPQEEEEDALALIERFSQWAQELRLLSVAFNLQPAAPLTPSTKAANNAFALPPMMGGNELENLNAARSPLGGDRTGPIPSQNAPSRARPGGPEASVTQRIIEARFHGEYRAIAEFLSRAVNMPRLITVESLHITREDQLIPNLKVAVTFRVYSRSPAAPSKGVEGKAAAPAPAPNEPFTAGRPEMAR